MMHFNYNIFPRTDNVNNVHFLNTSIYSIVNTITVGENYKRLFPYFLLNTLQNVTPVICEDNNPRFNLTKLQLLRILNRSNSTSLKRFITTTGLKYYFNSGIIQDENHNTLMCYCVDLSKVNFETKENIPLNNFYLLLDTRLLRLPEHKKLLSILNSKDSFIEHAIESGIDIIQTSNINNKIFDTVDIVFGSISDRKKYFQEKIQQIYDDITPKEVIEEKIEELQDVGF